MRSRNVVVLLLGQAMSMSAFFIVVLLGGPIGSAIAPSPAWATLPISIMVVGVAISVIPAIMLMRRIGRRLGFVTGATIAGLGALLAAYAVARGSFVLFCVATVFVGVDLAFVQQYRFAAAESVEPLLAGRAVSFVLLATVLGGYVGPELVKRTKDWLAAGTYTGSFAAMAAIFGLAAVLLLLFRDVSTPEGEALGSERPLGEIAKQPIYLVAVLSGAVAYAVMSFIMTATPLFLLQDYSLDQTAWVIQSHVVAMYLPSLFAALIVERLGLLRMMLVGLASMIACVVIAVFGRELAHFWGALVLLGIGWNFVFVGATVLLGRSHWPAERFKAQAANDFVTFGVQALGALWAGTLLFYANWDILNLITLPFLLATVVAVTLLRRQTGPAPSGVPQSG